MATSYRRIAAVKTTLDILEHLANQGRSESGTAIAEALGIPYGTVMSHLATLSDRGYVRQNGELFAIGARMATFWSKARANLLEQRQQIDEALEAIGV